MPVTPPPVATSRLGVNIAGRPILRDILMSIQSGEVVAILGANGSGKSTLIKAILNQAAATSGSVALFGAPARGFRDWARIGYVPQHSSLSQGVVASVKEVVASGRLSRRGPFRPSRTTDRRAIAEALDVVGLADRAGHPVSTLSGGQRQRVLIARALAGQPELLIMDEPNAGVDLGNQQAIADSLHDLVTTGSTLVLVLHELGPFAPWIQRCLVLSEGRLVFAGAPEAAPVVPGTHHHHPPESAHPSAHEGLIQGGS